MDGDNPDRRGGLRPTRAKADRNLAQLQQRKRPGLTLGGDYLISKIMMDHLLKTLDLVIAHLNAGSPLDPENGAALGLVEAREDLRSTSGLWTEEGGTFIPPSSDDRV